MKAGKQSSIAQSESESESESQDNEAHVALKEGLRQAVTLDPELREKISLDVVERLSRNPNLIHSLSVVRTQSFVGPFPPPDMLEKYDQILPGAAERIFSLTEREQQHRHCMQSKTINGTLKKDWRGQWMGFISIVLILLIACYFACTGNNVFAMALVTIDLVTLAAIFVVGRLNMKSTRQAEDTPKKP